ncbi:MAG: hypothetical protein PHI97_32755 [Desulfobulbus sp.]|nr:hypothetical protein [Desulfobulbus sp.]
MYRSLQSQDPLSQKVREAIQGIKVDLSSIPTFTEPYPDYLQQLPLQDYRFDHGYPLFVHRDAAPIRVRTTEPAPIGPGPQARLTSGLPVVSELPGLRVKRCVDFLKVSFHVKWDGRESDLLPILDLMKKVVQDTEKDCIPVFKEHGFDWNLYRTGTRYYTYRIKSGDVTLLFNRRSHDQKIPNCRLEIGSLSCWSPGFYAVYERVKTFLALHGGEVVKERVSEVHLAADFIGVDIKTTELENRSNWVALARNDDIYDGLKVTKRDPDPDPEELDFNSHYTNRKFSGITIGSGDMMFRAYDKVMELKKKRATNKQQVFAEIWGVDKYDDEPVTRLEYQIRRPRLREFADVSHIDPIDGKRKFNVAELKGNQIDTVADLVNSLKSLWAYLTSEWTRHTESPVNRNHNQTKAKISEFWEKVQAVVWTGVFGYIRIHPAKHKDVEMLRKQARGILMSVCASLEVKPDDIDKIVYLCQEMIEEDLHRFFEDEQAFIEKMEIKRNEFRLTLAG